MEDYEKKYKESLARARKYKNGEIEHDLEIGENIMEYVFPELKESEDERIRKEIIKRINNIKSATLSDLQEQQYNTWLAWLEKHKYTEDDLDKAYKPADIKRLLQAEYKKGWDKALLQLPKEVDSQIWQIANNSAKTWEQSFAILCASQKAYDKGRKDALREQKHADKVEPKFKIGDWVIDKQGSVHQIANVIENVTCHTYGYDIVGGGYFNDKTEGVRLWTMQDVKAGSIIAADPIEGIEGCSFSSSFIAIYKERNGEDFDSYCFVGFDGKFCKGTTGHSTDNIHPATKEQRETLFKAMRKAGYEWDAEHKQLNKIEQKSVRSEEDIKILERIIYILDSIRYYNTIDNKQEIPYQSEIDFLKSLKERYTWKPSVEQLNTLFKYAEQNNKDGSILTSLYQELKKLKE